MLLTPHAMVGAAIGASTDNLTYIIILAFLSHFILDIIPHFDWGTWHDNKDFKLEIKDYLLVATDVVTLLIFTIILWDNINTNYYIFAGMFFAVLVDLIFNVPFWKKFTISAPILKYIQLVHQKLHFRLKKKYWYIGVITQIIIIFFAFYIVYIQGGL